MAIPSRWDRVRRIMVFPLLALSAAASLLVFPSALLWMAAFWLAIASVQILRSGSAWMPFAMCAAILVIKRPEWSPALLAFGSALFGAAFVLFWLRAPSQSENARRKVGWAFLVPVWVLWLASVWDSYHGTHVEHPIAFDPDRPIVCVGDSLTTGLADVEAYPPYLQHLVSVPVLNWGRAGVTAWDMTKHLAEILESRPQAVVVELGGHDFLRGYGRAATRENLATIIEACRAADAAVVLVEIPRGFITDPFSGLERELAREYDLELISDSAIRMLVVRSPVIPIIGDLAQPHLSDDGLHPNEAGARMLAVKVLRSLGDLYGPAICREARETPRADSR